jgi:hypothetical protein
MPMRQTRGRGAAIAGGLAEALLGIPDELAQGGLARLPEDMKRVVAEMYEVAGRFEGSRYP